MPGPYSDGTTYYKVDADNLRVQTISSVYQTRTEIHAEITSATTAAAAADTYYDGLIAAGNAKIAVLDAP